MIAAVMTVQFFVFDPAFITFVGVPPHGRATVWYFTLRAVSGLATFALPMLAGAVAAAQTRRIMHRRRA